MPGNCIACGGPLEPGVRFCPLCGQPSGPGDPPPALEPLPSGNDPESLDHVKRIGWNWGGFFLPYLWLMGHGRVSAGFALLLSAAVPIVNLAHLFLYPGIAIYLGMQGYEISWKYRSYHSVEQLQAGEREWAWWGGLCLFLLVTGTLLCLVYFRATLGEVMREMETLGTGGG